MSSSLGSFGRSSKRDSRRKRLQRVGVGLFIVGLVAWNQLQPVLESSNLSILGSSDATFNHSTGTIPADIPWILISPNELGRMDYFSDSWLMNRERFLQIQVETIETVEEACFQVIDADPERTQIKMFVDWTNFSVEHLSKWWKRLNALTHVNSGISDHIVHKLKTYLLKVRDTRSQHSTASVFPKQSAIAMIAFQSYESVESVGLERGHQLTSHSLAATIASLYQVGFHRIVVGGYQPNDSQRVQEGFRVLESSFENTSVNERNGSTNDELEPSLQLGETQVSYVHLEQSWVKTKQVAANIPRALLLGMQKALRNEFSPKEQAKWIGSSSESWLYFYLTEPDTILNTKPGILPLLKSGLDQGWVFFPHRWQPIPHEADLPSDHASFLSPSRYIPQNVAPFSNITTFVNPFMANINIQGVSHCCDDGMYKPGRSEEFGIRFKPCGKWWWACGYSSSNPPGTPLTPEQVLDLHKRLVPYPMMRLDGGTSAIVAASEFGRRCWPSKVACTAAPAAK